VSEGPRKPPPRFPRPGDKLERFGDEEIAPETQREVIVPPPPRLPMPREPFKVIKGRAESFVELSAQIADIGTKLEAVVSSQAVLIGVQRKQSLQIDGLGNIVNQRAEILHRELALLRATVTGDHGPRLEAAEEEVKEVKKLTAKEKAKLGTILAAKFGGGVTVVLLVVGPLLRGLAKLYPDYGELLNAIVELF
jgi:hypothetical protein